MKMISTDAAGSLSARPLVCWRHTDSVGELRAFDTKDAHLLCPTNGSEIGARAGGTGTARRERAGVHRGGVAPYGCYLTTTVRSAQDSGQARVRDSQSFAEEEWRPQGRPFTTKVPFCPRQWRWVGVFPGNITDKRSRSRRPRAFDSREPCHADLQSCHAEGCPHLQKST